MKLIKVKDVANRPDYILDLLQNVLRNLLGIKFPERIEKEQYNVIRAHMIELRNALNVKIKQFDRDVLDD